jgi:hypothetical protein
MSSQSRHVYTRNERIILETSFARQSHPDINEKERLAKMLNCNIIQISNWFQNHRVNIRTFSLNIHLHLLLFSVELRNKINRSYQTFQQLQIQALLILLFIKQLVSVINRLVHSVSTAIMDRIIIIHRQLNMPIHMNRSIHKRWFSIHLLLMNNRLYFVLF